MDEDRFSDEYPEEDAEFYDGLEDHPGHPYPTIYADPARGSFGAGYLTPPRPPEPEKPLMTPEEFIRKFGYGGKK